MPMPLGRLRATVKERPERRLMSDATTARDLSPRTNRILAGLTDQELEQFSRDGQRIYLEPKAPMIQPNQPITVVDFPLYGLASQLAVLADGSMVEVGPIGSE